MRRSFFSTLVPCLVPWAPRIVVAIPAKDEAERLPACLDALDAQIDAAGRRLPRGAYFVLVFANNCRDATAEVARHARVGFPLRVVEAALPVGSAHAGGARRAAMDLAAAWLAELGASDGVIATSDADSRVGPRWISAQRAAFAEGAEAVLGRIALDEEGELLPPALHARGANEGAYERLLTELEARLDPEACDPWPRHSTISGASLALTRELYLHVGGLPAVRLGEDKALLAQLRRHDARVRHALDVEVVTSGRIAGRASGGVADTLRLRSEDPGAVCDDALEPFPTAFRRALWRGRLRRGGLPSDGRWRVALRVSNDLSLHDESSFGAAWERIEAASPALLRRALLPAELPRHIAMARRMMRLFPVASAPPQRVEPVFPPPIAADDFEPLAKPSDEELGSLVAG